MLVLDRKPGESIRIGPSIEVKVLEVATDGTVRIGISAPADISIHRAEVYRRMGPVSLAHPTTKRTA